MVKYPVPEGDEQAVSENTTPLAGIVPGDRLNIQGKHADGTVYRWWSATVEAVSDSGIVAVWPVGTRFSANNPEEQRSARRRGRAHFWLDRWYDIVEVYDANDQLGAIFADICAPAIVEGHRLSYVDHELDVVQYRGQPAFIEDEDEFAEAAHQYGYSREFQDHCRRVTANLLEIVERWVPGPPPVFPDQPATIEPDPDPVPPDAWP